MQMCSKRLVNGAIRLRHEVSQRGHDAEKVTEQLSMVSGMRDLADALRLGFADLAATRVLCERGAVIGMRAEHSDREDGEWHEGLRTFPAGAPEHGVKVSGIDITETIRLAGTGNWDAAADYFIEAFGHSYGFTPTVISVHDLYIRHQ